MAYCSFCGTELSANVRFCSACGKPVTSSKLPSGSDEMATIDYEATAAYSSPLPPQRPASATSSKSSSRSSAVAEYLISEGRFLPGRLIAGRYRIIALLGKGGMGEVYRADDLTLGQAVAMKFLPDEATSNEDLLERFRQEVRIARRVSHPNVCRVYDVGEVDGQSFFTMEYIDGEDLASLLRRIGRLPQDKAVEISRQLCAGLAAAHTKGVLHRDLKPANIMLDGRGQAVITDFGLAGIADDIRGPEVRSGTPAYMAPEQLAGKEVSTLSDIYALGLVLYEVFTGKRAFAEKSVGALHGEVDRTPSRPSSVVRDLDPVIEKVILRCLEENPASRPPNALAVSAALPGGDPLAAALAAGETPSPELVAASGETEGLRPKAAIAILAGVLVGLAFMMYLSVRYNGYDRMNLDLTPEVLQQKAREVITRLGYEGKPADSSYGLEVNGDFQDWVEKNDKPRPDWDAVLSGRPSLLKYWYRQSPDTLVANDFHDNLLTPGVVTETDPPTILSGMINVQLDPKGRLISFQAIPAEKLDAGKQIPNAPTAPAATPFDWNILFGAAGLDPSRFQPTSPMWNSLAASDTRAAWTGFWPSSNRPLRVEAASFQGKPVFFQLIGDWTKPQRMVSSEKKTLSEKVQRIIGILLLIGALVGSGFLARRNYLRGRGDRDGALRIAIVIFVLEIALFFCRAHIAAIGDGIGLTIIAISTALFTSGAIWMFYMAIEPWVRRQWPNTIISWTRLLSGKFRDPVVCRDILLGVTLGVVWISVFDIRYLFMIHFGASPGLGDTDVLMGGRVAFGAWLRQWAQSIQTTLMFFLLLMGLKALLRKQWLAAIAFVAIFALPQALSSSHLALDLTSFTLVYAIAVLIVIRFGLVPLAVAIFTINLTANLPFSSDFSAWYMTTSVLALLSVLAITAWGFYHSLGGRPLWKMEVD
ncbi:MAG TPA: serine/threonine-protein kinase [Candidatus Sulfotelmatobacter sp.]|nr:serine/threonine-protein kinase [Candidatus Sulfotelmatobacter sp.]